MKPKSKRKFLQFLLKNRQIIADLLPSAKQVKTMGIVSGKGCLTAPELAGIKNVSIQAASTTLYRLWRVGYLNRDEIGDPTGGKMFVYTCSFKPT